MYVQRYKAIKSKINRGKFSFLPLIKGYPENTIMILLQKQKEWIEKILASLYFVKWDRYVDIIFKKQRALSFFGWIDREKDSFKDFVCIEFNLTSNLVYFIATSSKKRSKEITEIIGEDKHNDCKRVEDNFEVSNVINL